MKKLILKGNGYLNEIFQSLDIKFSFVKKEGDTYTQLHNPCKCRDFLGDCIWSKETGKTVGIYGFQYDYKSAPYDSDAMRMSLTFPKQENMDYFKNNFELIKNKDKEAGVSESVFYETDQKLTLIVEADKLWQESIWKLSLYTFYIKLFSYKDEASVSSPENGYISKLTKPVEAKFLSKVTESGKEIMNKDSLSNSHHYSGFVSIISGYNKNMNAIILGA